METFIRDLEVFLGCFGLWCDVISPADPRFPCKALSIWPVQSAQAWFQGSRVGVLLSRVGWLVAKFFRENLPKINDPKKVG